MADKSAWELVFGRAAATSGFASDIVKSRMIGLLVSAGFASGGDQLPPEEAARLERELKKIFAALDEWNPKESPPNLDTGHYDDGHAFGWNNKDVAGVKDGLTIPTTPADQLPDLVARIYADAGKPLPLYRFSFSGLSATI